MPEEGRGYFSRLLGGSSAKCRNQDAVRSYCYLGRRNRHPVAAFLTWRDGITPYKATITGSAAFAATVLLAMAVEQALGVLSNRLPRAVDAAQTLVR